MAEDKYQHTVNGQAVEQEDLNILGDEAALADDRVLAELLRIMPYDGSTVTKGILPFGIQGSTSASVQSTVTSTGSANNSVTVRPFRAIVGSRTAVASDAKKNWRDIRSAISIGSTTLESTIQLAANSSGNPRWDLIYAEVKVDENATAVTRKVKNSTTGVVSTQSVVTLLKQTVTLAVQSGTPAATPTFPTAPADSGNTYRIPLAYVRVPNGATVTSTILATNVREYANVLRINEFNGAFNVRPGTGCDQGIPSAEYDAWGSAGTRPHFYLPRTMVGGQSVFVGSRKVDGNIQVLDDAIDWRKRYVRGSIQVFAHGGRTLASAPGVPFEQRPYGTTNARVNVNFTVSPEDLSAVAALAPQVQHFLGSSFLLDSAALTLFRFEGTSYKQIQDESINQGNSSDNFAIFVDPSTGALKVDWTPWVSVPGMAFFLWLDATAPFPNHA